METFKRALFALQNTWHYRAALKSLLCAPSPKRENLDFAALKSVGITTMIFDFDGILASHARPEPDAEGVRLIRQAIETFEYVFILSNKPNEARKTYFSTKFPVVRFITGTRKKPYPDGLNSILQETGAVAEQLCIVDDRLTTGALVGVIAGIKVIYILNPVVDFTFSLLSECFFVLIRFIERLLVRIIG